MVITWIQDPSEVWDKIKAILVDDNGEYEKNGKFVGVFDEDKMAGAFLVKPMNDYCYEVHGGISPEYFGQGYAICRSMGVYVFNHTSCLKIVAIVPVFNRLMIRCLGKIGLKKEGLLTKSFMKGFKMHDQVIMGITKQEARKTKGEYLCHQQR
jgi:RimJ/RimL family protein N-acetyltransferase